MANLNIKYILSVSFGTLFSSCYAVTTQNPNVIIIYADDLGYGDVSCNGAIRINTPNIDKIANSGIRFTNAHATAATSTPSRFSLLTGKYAWRQEGTGVAPGDSPLLISPESYTMPDMFHDAGYSTAAIGKWHLGLGATGKQDWNGYMSPGLNDIGFDYSFIMAATGDRVPCVYMENSRVVNLDPNDPIEVSYKQNFEGQPTGKNNPELLAIKSSHGHNQTIINGIGRIGYMKGGKSALWKDEEIADVLTKKAVDLIKSKHEKPFFLYFATHDIHVPRVPNERFRGKTKMGVRGDAIAQFDWSVGEIIKALEISGQLENTLIILTSDNGGVVDDGYQDKAVELLGSHTPNGVLRGGKYSAFEGGTRVPCIVSWKRKIKPKVSDALLSQIDLFASLAHLTGVKLKNGNAPDSFNQLNAWFGKSKTGRPYIVEQSMNNVISVIKSNYKYIEPSEYIAFEKNTNTELGNKNEDQLYFLKTDIGEKNNIAHLNKKKTKSMSMLLKKIKK